MEPIVLAAIISGSSVIAAAAIKARGQVKAAVMAAAEKKAHVAPDRKAIRSERRPSAFGVPFWFFLFIMVAGTVGCIAEIQDASGRIDRGALTVAILFPIFVTLMLISESFTYIEQKKKEPNQPAPDNER